MKMDFDQAKIRIGELRDLIRENDRRYYVENMPVISDYDYDMLMRELLDLEREHPQLDSPDSPTHHVGSDLETVLTPGGDEADEVRNEFVQRAHKYPMLSLGNTYDISEVSAFAERVSKSIDRPFTYSCELKFDGTAICLTYRDGLLVQALTRGDGVMGDDVTANARHIRNIPQRLSGEGWPREFEIRGEVLMPYEAFDRLNAQREIDEDQPFANPRNAAAGSLKLARPREVASRGLECTLYHILGEDLPFATHDEALCAAASWGLPVSDKRQVKRSIEEIQDYISYWDTERKLLPFATDGIVIKVNELDLQRQLGYTAKSPRWAVAYKFKAEQALSRVLSIDYQVGRTGTVTPVANMEPKPLSGTIVKRATLHNADQMRMLDIRIGDYVYVEKGGEIIPKITGVELSKRDSDAVVPEFPTVCPDCGTPLRQDPGEARWFCPNEDGCPTQIMGKLVHFFSRKAMNVIIGEATVRQLLDLGLVKSPADFYSLTREDLLRLDGWKERSAQRFLQSLDGSREVEFDHVLFALGIRHVGETTAKALCRHFGDIDTLAGASREQLLEVEDIGEVIADSIIEFFSKPEHRVLVDRLREAGLRFSMEAPRTDSAALEGRTIVISGNFSVSRNDMKALIERNGGRNSGSVSSKTSWLLAGTKPGPEKLRKAAQLGIPVISEEDLLAMLKPAGNDETEHKTGEQLELFGNE